LKAKSPTEKSVQPPANTGRLLHLVHSKTGPVISGQASRRKANNGNGSID
jgi:hypothetical protein